MDIGIEIIRGFDEDIFGELMIFMNIIFGFYLGGGNDFLSFLI